uniref:Transposase n=1 Tax=Steinernema glaseri TaxID=37863 RepID=A0A1I7Y056_9BILA
MRNNESIRSPPSRTELIESAIRLRRQSDIKKALRRRGIVVKNPKTGIAFIACFPALCDILRRGPRAIRRGQAVDCFFSFWMQPMVLCLYVSWTSGDLLDALFWRFPWCVLSAESLCLPNSGTSARAIIRPGLSQQTKKVRVDHVKQPTSWRHVLETRNNYLGYCKVTISFITSGPGSCH